MKIIILGSAAGGGYPQWNCACDVCALFWASDPRVLRRTQSSVAVSPDGQDWLLLNCSPDIREQIAQTKALHPKSAPRHSPITQVLLTNADIDHIAGLLSLRESQPFTLWASDKTHAHLAANSVFTVLQEVLVPRQVLETGKPISPLAELSVIAFEVPGKVPLFQEQASGHAVSRDGNTIGVHIDHHGHRLSYVPGCGAIDAQLLSDLSRTEVLLFDGTLWRDDEMITSGTGTKTGRRMGHVPISGPDGAMKALETLKLSQRYFVHMNNTNPVLVKGAEERQMVEAMGWRVSHDGLEIML
jgi:pyrroloquinoline quinone biosynthesis protein B